MEKINYELYKEIISYLKEYKTQEEIALFFRTKGIDDEELIQNLIGLNNNGKKHITSLEKIFMENGELSSLDIIKYSNKINELIEHHKFAPPLLIKELPNELIENFNQSLWKTLTQTNLFKKSDYEGKKLVLKLACVFGVFENDVENINRASYLVNILQNKDQSELECYKDLKMNYNPHFFAFIKEHFSEVKNLNLHEVQKQWSNITKCVDIKTPENIQRYMQISKEKNGNEFETYMAYHNVSAEKMAKYKTIYNYMQGRTKTTLPTIEGNVDNGFSYEMLDFSDIRVMRFGETIKCCQALGNNAETSMIDSAIEASARVIMITDEKEKPIAGSFVTHQIGKDGRSYLCFDSIEVNASKMPVKAIDYSKTLRKINKLVNKGIIASPALEDIEKYFNENPNQKHITAKDIKALKINKKIREAYKVAIDNIIKKDENKRSEQLANGEITKEEYEHLLVKNGMITVGRNPVSMYLNDLPKVKKNHMELLPATTKDKSIYKKAHKITILTIMKKVAKVVVNASTALGTLLTLTGSIAPGVILIGYGIIGRRKLKGNFVHGIYSDATKDQRIFYDGRTNSYVSKINGKDKLKQLNDKLIYSKYDIEQKPIKISKLTEEQRKNYRRLREATGQPDFSEQEKDRYIIGNEQNWSVTITKDGENLVIHDISMLSLFGFEKEKGKLTDAQIELLSTLQTLSNYSKSISFECENKKINKYLSKNIKVPVRDNKRENIQQKEEKREDIIL